MKYIYYLVINEKLKTKWINSIQQNEENISLLKNGVMPKCKCVYIRAKSNNDDGFRWIKINETIPSYNIITSENEFKEINEHQIQKILFAESL